MYDVRSDPLPLPLQPWTMTWVMFWGEFLCLLFFLVRTRLTRKDPSSSDESNFKLLGTGEKSGETQPVTWRSSLVCFLPAMCDIGGTTL